MGRSEPPSSMEDREKVVEIAKVVMVVDDGQASGVSVEGRRLMSVGRSDDEMGDTMLPRWEG